MFFDVSIEACTISTILKRFRRLFLRFQSLGNRKDTRRLRFSFFLLQCQSAGNRVAPRPWEGLVRDRQTLAPVSLFREAGWLADRVFEFRTEASAPQHRCPSVVAYIDTCPVKCQAES